MVKTVNMKKSDLNFEYPSELVALAPQRPSRIMRVAEGRGPTEISKAQLLAEVQPGDVWVINNTRVMPRRVWTLHDDVEILFLEPLNAEVTLWRVLFPAARYKIGSQLMLPGGISLTLEEKGLPQVVGTSASLTPDYFESYGELPLPPYIQKLRASRHGQVEDKHWYQTDWAQWEGSLAAPTASLHFSQADLKELSSKGVQVLPITLHVGLGTFLPIQAENLLEHTMHREWMEVPVSVWDKVQQAKRQKAKVWALGTTATRALESVAAGKINREGDRFFGETDLFIYPGVPIQVVDRLLTNFHQPESTLMALVAGFQDLDRVKFCYHWAIQKRFRLFSYGDLSVWDHAPTS